MFSVGQKVVCVEDLSEVADSYWATLLRTEMPVKGEIYTIRRLVQRVVGEGEALYGLLLEEIVNEKAPIDRNNVGGILDADDPRLGAPDECAFGSELFRPLITAEDFLSVDKREPVAP